MRQEESATQLNRLTSNSLSCAWLVVPDKYPGPWRLPEPAFNTEGPYSSVLRKTRWVHVPDPRSCLLPASEIS
jgi:hypothetical protein